MRYDVETFVPFLRTMSMKIKLILRNNYVTLLVFLAITKQQVPESRAASRKNLISSLEIENSTDSVFVHKTLE